MRISDWSADVCSSDLVRGRVLEPGSRLGKGSGREERPGCASSPMATHAAGREPGRPQPVAGTALQGVVAGHPAWNRVWVCRRRSEEHTSELQSLMRISYAVFCLNKKTTTHSANYRTTKNKTQN